MGLIQNLVAPVVESMAVAALTELAQLGTILAGTAIALGD